jgi:predicted TIM-barrel fold metal-dependent hydrolase
VIVDAHAHVLDPARPLAAGAPAGPGDPASYAAVLTAHGVTHAVLVQPSGYGVDNKVMLAALAARPGNLAGIAEVPLDVGDAALERLAAGRVVGVRVNLVNFPERFRALDVVGTLVARLERRGWVVQLQCPAERLPEVVPHLGGAGPVVLDHLGLPDVAAGPSAPGFRAVLALGRSGRGVLKLSGAFRLSREPWPHPDLDSFVEAGLAAFGPERCVWGSDWPFIASPRPPTYAATLALLERWLPDPTARAMVLTHTPARLFGLRPG